eukprot:TRINITY_DN3492_c0_g1_i2.p1 TRINITY_DN3492_c0_g1~~TRINITY_DN3492_c0_g1_i2.p1  ORF type:complete len:344 (-),score=55.64 TRINITY_DN3492_c0_g1_i2:4-1035(-)
MNILSALPDTDEAMKYIRQASKEGHNIAIAATILQSIPEQSPDDLNKVLVRFFTDKSIPSDTLMYVLTLVVFQGGTDAAEVLIHAIERTKNLNRLVVAFDYAFTTNDVNITDAFITLVSASIEGERCGLEKVMKSMLKGVTDEEREQITVLLKQAGAGVCVELDLEDRKVVVNEAPIVEIVETQSKDKSEQQLEAQIAVPVQEIIFNVIAEKDDSIVVSAPVIEVDVSVDDAIRFDQAASSAPLSISPEIETYNEGTTAKFTKQKRRKKNDNNDWKNRTETWMLVWMMLYVLIKLLLPPHYPFLLKSKPTTKGQQQNSLSKKGGKKMTITIGKTEQKRGCQCG